MKILITSGGTKIKIDSVRSITNMSKGTFGSYIAQEFLELKHQVVFLHAKNSKTPFLLDYNRKLITFVEYETFEDYEKELIKELEKKPDIVVLAAAVSDYGVENPVDGKIRSGDDLVIRLKPLPKLISMVKQKCPDCILCGFKLLVNSTDYDLKKAVEDSINKNNCDLVVGNDLRDIKNGNHKLIIGKKNSTGIIFKEYCSENNNLPLAVVNNCLDV